ncbi:MAG: long-chain fatty acid--CoA ligase [Prevotellaceae bacterium]|jgi:long-chain acyl-CoA synthetase|nr:long-chain fatty acid--CoA ligase [Prevotellaceae bacterium]
MKIDRLFDLLDNYAENYPHQDIVISYRTGDVWQKIGVNEYIDKINAASFALLHLGISPGDKVGIVSGNRPEWNMIDFAAMQIGAISVPVYPNISQDDYRHILNHAEMKIIFIEGRELRKKLEPILPEMKQLREIITFSDASGKYKSFDDFIELGNQNPQTEKLETLKQAVKGNNTATIIYTSGTTGTQKGVMLSHANIINNFMNVADIPAKWSNKALSFLPVCHAYERMLVYLYHYLGMSIYYVSNLGAISQSIKEVNPTMMSCVPRLLEKIYNKLHAAGATLSPIQKAIYYWAFRVAKRYELSGKSVWYKTCLKIADKLVYKKWRAAIGGHFDIVVSGGSAIRHEIASFFSAIGMPVYEGYGLSETSPVIAVNRRKTRKYGTVGLALPGVEIKIGTRDEILCRGHNVMQGYYKDPELTAQIIDSDGWLHTGDTGKIDKEGYLIITGRLKSLFKTSFGKYVNPELVEAKLNESPFIENIVVIGENRKFAAALIVPDFAYLRNWCETQGIEYTSDSKIITDTEVKKAIGDEINHLNSNFGDYEQVKRYKLLADEWSIANGIFSPTMKVKRKIIAQRYFDAIEELFS